MSETNTQAEATTVAAPAAEATKAPAKRSPKKDAQTANKKQTDKAKEKAAAAKAKEAEKAKAAKEKAAAKKAADKAKADAKKEAAKAKALAKKEAAALKKANGNDERLVPANLESYVVDKEKKTPKGNPSVHCNDDVANLLLGKDLDKVYELAAKTLAKAGIEGASEAELRKRYKNLNPGMQRMNLGNRMRGALALAA